jgi:hypothetical protein
LSILKWLLSNLVIGAALAVMITVLLLEPHAARAELLDPTMLVDIPILGPRRVIGPVVVVK